MRSPGIAVDAVSKYGRRESKHAAKDSIHRSHKEDLKSRSLLLTWQEELVKKAKTLISEIVVK